MASIISRLEEIILAVMDLRADMEIEGMSAAAGSLRTTEDDLIWQYQELIRFDTT